MLASTLRHRIFSHLPKHASYATGSKTSLVGELRKVRPGTPVGVAKQALENGNWNIEDALVWLANNELERGAAKAQKLQSRTASEGLLIAHQPRGSLLSLVELKCETDFVARTPEFATLGSQVAAAVSAYVESSEAPQSSLKTIDPAFAESIETSGGIIPNLLASGVARFGEKLNIARAVSFFFQDASHTAASYLHGSSLVDFEATVKGRVTFGNKAGLVHVACNTSDADPAVDSIAAALARQIIAMQPTHIHPENKEDEDALLLQNFMTLPRDMGLPGDSVQSALEAFQRKSGLSLTIPEFYSWTLSS